MGEGEEGRLELGRKNIGRRGSMVCGLGVKQKRVETREIQIYKLQRIVRNAKERGGTAYVAKCVS